MTKDASDLLPPCYQTSSHREGRHADAIESYLHADGRIPGGNIGNRRSFFPDLSQVLSIVVLYPIR